MHYQDVNAATIDRWVEEGWTWGKPIPHETYMEATKGRWDVLLTPTKPVPHDWFGELKGRKLLGLASGGGQQMPIFAALGAEVTVLDYSERQLASERMVSEREGYAIEILRADMSQPLPFADESFDIIFHPVSNIYVEEVLPIWRECYRILKPGGILLAGLDSGINYVFDDRETEVCGSLPFNPLRNPEHRRLMEENGDGYEFSHNISEQIGGQLAVGFCLTHVFGDTNGVGNLHEHGVESFWATRAVKPGRT